MSRHIVINDRPYSKSKVAAFLNIISHIGNADVPDCREIYEALLDQDIVIDSSVGVVLTEKGEKFDSWLKER